MQNIGEKFINDMQNIDEKFINDTMKKLKSNLAKKRFKNYIKNNQYIFRSNKK